MRQRLGNTFETQRMNMQDNPQVQVNALNKIQSRLDLIKEEICYRMTMAGKSKRSERATWEPEPKEDKVSSSPPDGLVHFATDELAVED